MYEAASSRCSAGGPLGNLQRCPHYTAEYWVLCSREKSQPARKKDAKQLPNRGLKRYLLPHTCQNTNMHICRWLVSGRWRSHQGTRSTSRSCGGSRRLESWVPLGTSPEDLGFSMRFFQAGCETSMMRHCHLSSWLFLWVYIVGQLLNTTFWKKHGSWARGLWKINFLSFVGGAGWLASHQPAWFFVFSTYPDNLRLCISLVTSLLSISYLSLPTSIIFHHAISHTYVYIYIPPQGRNALTVYFSAATHHINYIYIHHINQVN